MTRLSLVRRSIWFRNLVHRLARETFPSSRKLAVVNLGAGFDTTVFQFEADPQIVAWIDCDLPNLNAIKLARFPDTSQLGFLHRIYNLDLSSPNFSSLLAPSHDSVDPRETDLVLLLQGVLMYLPAPTVLQLFEQVAELNSCFPRLYVGFDWCSPFLNRFSRLHPGFLWSGVFDAPFQWSLRSTEDISQLSSRFKFIQTDDPIYGETSPATKLLKWFHSRIRREPSAGIYGCSVIRATRDE